MTDPVYRSVALRRKAAGRLRRRVDAMLAYIATHPLWTRDTDPQIARLDDLVGEADSLRRRL